MFVCCVIVFIFWRATNYFCGKVRMATAAKENFHERNMRILSSLRHALVIHSFRVICLEFYTLYTILNIQNMYISLLPIHYLIIFFTRRKKLKVKKNFVQNTFLEEASNKSNIDILLILQI